MSEQLTKRLKAFGWGLATMLAAVIVDYTAANIGMFDMPEYVVVPLGLILAQVTKYLNTKQVSPQV